MPDSSRLAEDALTRPRTSIGPQSSALTSERASQQNQPISEAVTSAVQDASRTAQFDPELISTIVAKVLEQVMMKPAQQHALQSTPVMQIPISHSRIPQSPPQFTPPTPGASFAADFDDRDLASPSPGPALSDSGSHFSQLSMGSMRSNADSRDETPRPPRASHSNRSSRSFHSSSVDAVSGSNASMLYQGVRSRNDSKASNAARTALPMDEVPRPKISEESETPLERTWQPLFLDGEATPRLSQFLRGIALHLISNVEPRNGLVVTPEKMIQFFSGTKVDGEHYPWESIFKGMAPYSISDMYRKLELEHHLVQTQARDKPSIPGLTPEGFAMYLTLLIRAHPDIEYERMARVIKNMAICNADNVKERFPKELPRRLFPPAGDVEDEKRLISSLAHEEYVLKEIRGAADTSLQVKASPVQEWQRPEQSYPERERQPYSRNVMSNAFDDDDLNSPMFPIERERQPHVTGDPTQRSYATETSQPQARDIEGGGTSARRRANSGYTGEVPSQDSSSFSRPVPIPQPRMPHRISSSKGSVSFADTAGGAARSIPSRPSPPATIPNRKGAFETFNVGSAPAQPFGSKLHPVQSYPEAWHASDKDQSQRQSGRRRRDSVTNSSRAVPEARPARNRDRPDHSINAYEPGSMGGPVGALPPPPSRPIPPNTRKQSMFPISSGFRNGGDGSADGSESYARGVAGEFPLPPQQPHGSLPRR